MLFKKERKVPKIMKKTVITADMAIWSIAKIKGKKGGEIIKVFFDEEGLCSPGTSPLLSYVAKLRGKKEVLPHLLERLNSLEDVCCIGEGGGCIFCVPPML